MPLSTRQLPAASDCHWQPGPPDPGRLRLPPSAPPSSRYLADLVCKFANPLPRSLTSDDQQSEAGEDDSLKMHPSSAKGRLIGTGNCPWLGWMKDVDFYRCHRKFLTIGLIPVLARIEWTHHRFFLKEERQAIRQPILRRSRFNALFPKVCAQFLFVRRLTSSRQGGKDCLRRISPAHPSG